MTTNMWDLVQARFQPDPLTEVYRADPVRWAKDRLHRHMWSMQRDIMRSVVDHRRTAVQSCHGPGKSLTAATLAAWWIDTHPIGQAMVISTAPTYPQVHAILWEEIRRAHRIGALPGRVLRSDEWQTPDGVIVGMGRKPADTDEHGFQGFHRRYVLVILDEACGIPDQLWTAVEAVTTNADCRILAIGNPDDPGTTFARNCGPGSGWNTIKISAFETPNFTGELVPSDLRPMLVSQEWVDDARKRWGTDSPLYKSKVLGEFPETSADTLIPASWIIAAQQRTIDPDPVGQLGVDVARYGADRTVVYHRRGGHVRLYRDWSHAATTQTTGLIVQAIRELNVTQVQVDGVGVGGGVVDQLLEQGFPVLDMQAGGGALDNKRFVNARAEWFWRLREMFDPANGGIDIDPADDELASQLGALRFTYDSRGRIKIEGKDDMKKRGMPSPDRADALMLAFATMIAAPLVAEPSARPLPGW